MKPDYCLSAEALREFAMRAIPDVRGKLFDFWGDFADTFSPALIPFLVRPDVIEKIPFAALSIPKIVLAALKQLPGEMWILFCFKDSMRDSIVEGSPLRTDGFPLVLEWRKDKLDSPLLSSAFHVLAEQVRKQLDLSGWGLWPAYRRYHDNVDFTDVEIFADSDDSRQIASAHGALLAGLLCAETNSHPKFWPFPTLQWDSDAGRIAGVEGLRKKFSVAVDCGAVAVTVAQEQKREAEDVLKRMRREPGGARFRRLSVYAVKHTNNAKRLSENIAYGAANFRRLIRRIVAAITIPFCLLLTTLGLFAWDSSRIVYEYYDTCGDSFGLPFGITPVLSRHVVQRVSTFRFEYKGYHLNGTIHNKGAICGLFGFQRKLIRVTRINHKGYPFVDDDLFKDTKAPIKEFMYDSKDVRLLQCIERKRGGPDFVSGCVLKREHYANVNGETNNFCRLTRDNEQMPYFERLFVHEGFEKKIMEGSRSPICAHQICRDENGLPTELLFCDANGDPTTDGNGIGGERYVYDDRGYCTNHLYLGLNHMPSVSKSGVLGTRQTCLSPEETCLTFYGITGKPVVGPEGFARMVATNDKWGNVISARYYDIHDNLVGLGGRNIDSVICDGREKERRFIGNDGESLHSEGVARVTIGYNEFGDAIEYHHFDCNGMPLGHDDKYYKRDDLSGDITNIVYKNETGDKPAYSVALGVHEIRRTFKNDMLCAEEYYDAYGERMPARERDGAALYTWIYEGGMETEIVSYDARLTPLRRRRKSYTKGKGNTTWLIDEIWDGNKFIKATEDSEHKYQYDEAGRLTADIIVNDDSSSDDSHITGKTEWHYSTIKRGEMLYPRHTALSDMHVHWQRNFVLDKGSVMKEMPGTKTFYNDLGQMVLYCNVDCEGEPLLPLEDGKVAAYRYAYDKNNNLCEIANLNTNGSLMARIGWDNAKCPKYAVERREYDELHRLKKVWYLDEQLKLTFYFLGVTYSEVRYEYDETNRTKRKSFWHDGRRVVDGSGVHCQVERFNRSGQLCELSYYDQEGNLTPCGTINGFCRREVVFDAKGNKIKILEYVVDTVNKRPKLVNCKVFKYDELNRCVEEINQDANGNAQSDLEGNGIVSLKVEYYGNTCNIRRRDQYSSKCNPCMHGSTNVWHQVDLYSPTGLQTDGYYYDSNDKLCGIKYNDKSMSLALVSVHKEYHSNGRLSRCLEHYEQMRDDGTFDQFINRVSTYDSTGTLEREGEYDGNMHFVREIKEESFVDSGLIVIGKVLHGTPAAEAGFCFGDYLLRVGNKDCNFDVLATTNIFDVIQVLGKTRDVKKNVVVARVKFYDPDSDSYTVDIFSKQMPPKGMGMQIMDQQFKADMRLPSDIKTAYREWLKTHKIIDE